MKKKDRRYLLDAELIASAAALVVAIFGAYVFYSCERSPQAPVVFSTVLFVNQPGPLEGPVKPMKRVQPVKPKPFGYATVTAVSPAIFEYAHGTVVADGQFWIGMRDHDGNPFPTNEVIVFTDPSDLNEYKTITLPDKGSLESAIYDAKNDKVYFELADNRALDIYSIDPHTYAVSTVIATTSVDAGPKPAIVTDGSYIYGITNTDPSIVFKVRISDSRLTTDSRSHILNGHSAAIGIYGSSTELYFGGGIGHAFEKVDAATLSTIAEIMVHPCSITDDMPFSRIGSGASDDPDAAGGYVYLGCEAEPYGERVRTSDMSVTQFSLPGESYGLFVFGDDLYNAARDGVIDFFPGGDISKLERYPAVGGPASLRPDGNEPQLNELFYSPATASLYFTAWLGIPGLFKVATSTATTD